MPISKATLYTLEIEAYAHIYQYPPVRKGAGEIHRVKQKQGSGTENTKIQTVSRQNKYSAS